MMSKRIAAMMFLLARQRRRPAAGPRSMEKTEMAHRLGHEIGVALAAKVLALALLYLAFFDHSRRPTMTPSAVASKLFSASGAPGR